MPEGPEKGDDFDLPDRTSHNHPKGKFEIRNPKSETTLEDKETLWDTDEHR
jgi:hypothetical protein